MTLDELAEACYDAVYSKPNRRVNQIAEIRKVLEPFKPALEEQWKCQVADRIKEIDPNGDRALALLLEIEDQCRNDRERSTKLIDSYARHRAEYSDYVDHLRTLLQRLVEQVEHVEGMFANYKCLECVERDYRHHADLVEGYKCPYHAAKAELERK